MLEYSDPQPTQKGMIMTTATIKRQLEELRDGVLNPDLKVMLKIAADRVGPEMSRVTLAWIVPMLRDEGDRAACVGRDVLAAWLYDVACDIDSVIGAARLG